MSNEVVKRSDVGSGSEIQLSATAEMAVNRQTQEVQGAMVIAKRFPRDTTKAFSRIVENCQRKTLAEVACYEFPRGGTKVTGPSIRLAESMAQAWGNLDYGVIELEQRHRESTVMAYCWDLETNTRQTKIFQVPHIRYSRDKGNQTLTDPRDIYEMIANQGARRLRACILGIIPGDIQDAAINECEKTLQNDKSEPLVDRIRKMVVSFKDLGVTQEDIETLLMQKIEACSERDVIRLGKIYLSIKDGMSKKEDHFRPTQGQDEPATGTKAERLANKLTSQKPQGESTRPSQPLPTTEASGSTPAAPDLEIHNQLVSQEHERRTARGRMGRFGH